MRTDLLDCKMGESIINMSKQKVTDYIEIGPGKVLSGMVKTNIKRYKLL